ncbi:hypothetical protein NDU88_007540 [Pleurodeles waltl]|uniref:Uncharacterized protein n=1 Tax=Pleurodeles waltl TaxID=8319 RepID=A0AAV7QQ40_PLEWA|nr:hypothetical protein NDU88_007540 [Pleurodeles waltl]
MLQQAEPLCRTATDTASSDPEELAASSNPLPLPGNGGQEQGMRACWACKKEDRPGLSASERTEEKRRRETLLAANTA